jgi:Secretion system C-terminal sorting domain
MKRIIILLLFIYSNFSIFSQNQNSIWCFGDSAGIDFSNINNPIPIISSVSSRGSCASISDSAGDLLFYTNTRTGFSGNTVKVWNKNHQIMQNGDSIVGENWFNELVIVPFPDSINKYYLFSIGITGSSQVGMYYSVIDMLLNSGLGEVTQKNIPLLNDEMADCVRAIKHGNGRDFWVVAKLSSISLTHINRFFVFYIGTPGISLPIIQDFGNAIDGDAQRFCFSNDGNKIMLTNTLGFMCEYDFDRCTGLISNPNIIFPEQTANFTRLFWEGAYAPNDSLFYVTTTWYSFPNDTSRLLQYNLFASNIPTSCDTLFEVSHPIQPAAVRLAPDNKIYVTSFYDCQCLPNSFPYPDSVRNMFNENLSVVATPNNDGTACNFQPFSFYLGGKRTYSGLPNNPNYELGRWIGSPCDTLTVGVDLPIKNDAALFTFYHNTWKKLFINANSLRGKNCLLQIFDLNGKHIFSTAGKTQPPYFTQDIDLAGWSDGLYIVKLTTEKEKVTNKFVKY